MEKVQQNSTSRYNFTCKATSSMMSKFKWPACDNINHGFTNLGSSSVMTELKWRALDFIDGADELHLESSRCEELNNVAFERKVNDEIAEDDVCPEFMWIILFWLILLDSYSFYKWI